uniref:Uncharacterized protein n=1 Tax=Pseudictyota dubia TaxID=2749911 RepID=A0A7R9VT55_9STRA
MESILGRFEDVKGRVDEVLQRGRTLQEKLRAYSTLIKSIAFQGKKNDAASTAIAVLGCLGESFPSTPNESTVQEELVKTQAMLGAKKQDDILNMKLMQDADKREVMKLLAIAFQCDYAGNRTYVPLLLCRMVQLSLTFGLSRESAMAFAFYGFLISGFLNDRDIGSRFGKLALAMLDKFHKGECLVWVYGAVYGFISNWTDPIQASLPCLKHAVDVGLLTGDTEAAMLSAHLYVGTALHSGYQLEKLMDETNVYAKQMLEYNQNLTHTLNAPLRQTILNLLGRSANPVKLVGDEMNEDFLLQSAEENSHEVLRSMISLFRMWLAYLFGEYHLAAETAEKNQDFGEKTALSRFDPVCCHTFYNGLTALILARKEGQSKWTSTIESTTRRMEVLSSSSQWNCQHKLELMKAEYAYLEGNHSESANLYESAAKLAEKHHFIHDQALSLERAGMFYLENGNDTAASIMFEKSFSCYTKWGAYSKAAHLKRLYL